MSDNFLESEIAKRDVPSFIEPRPPLITNPFMRPRPQKGTNLMDLFEEDSECEESELVQVYLRLKPCNVPSNLYDVRGDRCLITSLDTTTAGHGRRTQHNVSKMYTFSHIFREDASQKEIFDSVVKENLKKLPEGRSFTLLTYGASGSGKTFTLMGTVASPGLVPRSLEYLFKTVEVEMRPTYKPSEGGVETLSYSAQEYELLFVKKLRKLSAPLRDKYRRMSSRLSSDLMGSILNLSNSTKHYVWVSFIEIYNEGIYDLLATTDRRTSSKLLIREDSNGNVYVKGATQAFVRSGEEAYDIMVAGKHNLQVAATGVHAQSSRSHCIFTITMLTETESGCAASCVRLCDLAGCERARRTRNTGARMQESRAINSSLHVLERCLHTLRRKQASAHHALVPYRESKLTRLLGAGLSGARGEAVSMVVTLNPSPEYAHETRHVLQLAAVAKDLQINNTVSEYPSSLESSSHDMSSSLNSEVLKLRTCNERLHFELLQAQARNRELMASIEEKQAENADTMRELVEEVQENCRQYYEPQIQAHKKEIEELKEEYETMISELKRRTSGTPSRSNKIDQLMTEITILKEKLTAERLARARAEEEVQHLRACIDERDENDEKANNDDDMSVNESDSEAESDDDVIYNESLEPTFTKEDIDRSRLIRQSLVIDRDNESSNDSVLDKSDNTLKDTSNTSDDCAFSDNIMATCKKASILECNKDEGENDIDLVRVEITSKGSYFFNDEDTTVKSKNLRGTFCISKPESNDRYELTKPTKDNNNSNVDEEDKVPDIIVREGGHFVSKLIKTESKRNDSLAQFEQLELASKASTEKSPVDNDFGENLHKKLGGFFDDTEKNINSPDDDGIVDVRSPSIVHDEEVTNNYEPSMIKKLLKKNLTISIDDKNHSQMRNDIFLDSTEKQPVLTPEHKFKMSSESVDLFESPHTANTQEITNVENIHKSHAVHIETLRVKIEKDVSISQKSENTLMVLTDTNKTTNNLILSTKDTNSQDINEEIAHETQTIEKSDIMEEIVQKITIKEDIVINEQKNSRSEIETKELYEITDVSSKLCNEKREIKKEIIDSIINIEGSPVNGHDVEIKKLNDKEINFKLGVVSSVILNEPSSKENKNSYIKKLEGKEYVMNLEDVSEVSPKLKETISVTIKEEKLNESDSEMKSQTISSDVFKVPLQKESANNKIDLRTEATCERINDVEEKETSNVDMASTSNMTINNTLEAFENIYKDVTLPRATQFDLLVSRSETTENDENLTETERKYNLRKKPQKLKSQDSKDDVLVEESSEKKDKKSRTKTRDGKNDEILLESHAKCEVKTKRNLRLRRRKDDETEEKLKDIVNLQTEFSDVTLDTPAPNKVVEDIPSPAKNGDENMPPIIGIQSCPSKSVARSRRKLFTPRAEPLEEGCPQTVDSNEQIRVPRPSYHRPRARRKL